MTTTVRPSPRRSIASTTDRLRVGIEVGGRLVEDHEPRLAKERPGDGDPLPLAAAQVDPVLADGRLVAVGHVGDELVRAGRAGGLDDRRHRRVGPGEADVLRDGPVEQVGRLGHVGDPGPPAGPAIDASSASPTVIRPVSGSMNRSSSRATVDFPAPEGPTIVRPLPGRDDEVEARERRLRSTGIGDRDAVEHDVGGARHHGVGAGDGDARLGPARSGGVQDLEHPQRGLATGGALVVGGGQPAEREEELRGDHQHGERGLEPDAAGHQAQAELDGDQRHRDRGAPLQHEACLERRPEHGHRRVAVAQADLADPPRLLAAPAVGPQRLQAPEHVAEVALHPAQLGGPRGGGRPDARPDQPEQRDEERSHHQQDERRRRIEDEHDAEHEQRRRRPRGPPPAGTSESTPRWRRGRPRGSTRSRRCARRSCTPGRARPGVR